MYTEDIFLVADEDILGIVLGALVKMWRVQKLGMNAAKNKVRIVKMKSKYNCRVRIYRGTLKIVIEFVYFSVVLKKRGERKEI